MNRPKKIRNRKTPLYSALPSVALGVDSNVHVDPQTLEQTDGPPLLPGAVRDVYFTSPVPLRLTYFRVHVGSAPHFLIRTIQAGRIHCIAGSNPVPASAFNDVSPPLDTAILPAGALGRVEVENIGREPQRFVAMFFGLDLTPLSVVPSIPSRLSPVSRPRDGRSDPSRYPKRGKRKVA